MKQACMPLWQRVIKVLRSAWLQGIPLMLMLGIIAPASADSDAGFHQWLMGVRDEALAQQISPHTVDITLSQAEYLPRVIELDRKQPEFVSSFSAYAARRVTPYVVNKGKQLMDAYSPTLFAVENTYHIPREVLVAFWALETNFGQTQGDFRLVSALATLSYEGRRAAFFRRELLNLLRVIDKEQRYDQPINGSWAGATGHMQFMPSTLLKYGVDADNDGKIDVWSSIPDIFSSAANYLAQSGWHDQEPVSVEVGLPVWFDYSQAQLKLYKPMTEWLMQGVQIPPEVHNQPYAAILLPQGYDGPAYMVFPNFDVIMQWNRSVNYALSVSLLSQQLRQPYFNLTLPPDPPALSFQQMWLLQEALNALGYDCGPPDGFPGAKTQAAIRQYQASQGLPQDGYAGAMLFSRLTGQPTRAGF